MQRALRFVHRQWFSMALVSLIACGLVVGSRLTAHQLATLTASVDPRTITAAVLFLMSFSLDSRRLFGAFQAPGPVVWASLVNYAFIPLLAIPLMSLQQTPDFAYGLMIAASMPCTMAGASVWTRKAGGNDAVALLVTVVTNGLCFLFTPFWLNLTTSAADISLDTAAMVVRLALVVLLPTLAAQVVRRWPPAERLAIHRRTLIGVIAQLCILLMVFVAACNAGARFNGAGGGVSTWAVVLVWATCIGLHLAGFVVAVGGGRRFRFSPDDCVAVGFAGSQKTLPIGLYVATDPAMFGNPDFLGPGHGVPFAVFPILMYHASQLVIDTGIADYLSAKARRSSKPEEWDESAATVG